jgi:hypothetical protein
LDGIKFKGFDDSFDLFHPELSSIDYANGTMRSSIHGRAALGDLRAIAVKQASMIV